MAKCLQNEETSASFPVSVISTSVTDHEELDRGRDVHEPERGLVLALLPALQDGVDVGGLVHAHYQPE